MQEHLNKTSRDRKRKNAQKDDPKSKKYKDFKFWVTFLKNLRYSVLPWKFRFKINLPRENILKFF